MNPPRLLLVDDSAEVAFIVRHLARRDGFEVIARADAELAWQYVQEVLPDLVLLDINLPGASGLDYCRWLRAAPPTRTLPVALLSHWQRPDDIAAGLDAGGDFVLSKDLLCQPDDWRRRLTEILDSIAGGRTPISLPWSGAVAAQRFDRTVRGPLSGRLGVEAIRALWRRAAARCDSPDPGLTADGLGFDLARADAPTAPPVAVAFTEQLWRLLGTVDSAPWLTALGVATPALTECTPCR
ncbi:MAG: response regulator [Planctomycetia bacterium]|nr:response regulator [Planctomycetia bacterium]